MILIRLRPDQRRLAHPHPEPSAPLSLGGYGGSADEAATVIGFRPPPAGRTARSIAVHGATRLRLTGNPVVLAHLQTDSRLALPLVWDIFHANPVGTRFTVIEDHGVVPLFARPYYATALRPLGRESRGGSLLWHYEKTAPGVVNDAAGLDGWSFAVRPVLGDATALRLCLARLRALGLADMEILVAGPVADGGMSGAIRAVVPGPSAAATRDALAAAATRPNLCQLDDRHILPANFHTLVRDHGDGFGFLGIQTLSFLDRAGLHGQRHHDAQTLDWLMPGAVDAHAAPPAPPVPLIHRFGPFITRPAHAGDYRDTQHLTGIRLCKTALWRLHPADRPGTTPTVWDDGAVVEHGLRLAAAGIPSLLMVRGFAQALLPDPTCLGTRDERDRAGTGVARRGLSLAWLPSLPWRAAGGKPLLPVTADDHRRGLYRFIADYVEPPFRDEVRHAVATTPLTARGHLFLALLVLDRAPLRRDRAALAAFLDAYFATVVRVPLPPFRKARLLALVAAADGVAFTEGIRDTLSLRQLAGLCAYGRLFGGGAADALVPDTGWAAVGRRLFALWWLLRGRSAIAHHGTWAEVLADLRASTPFTDLLDGSAS